MIQPGRLLSDERLEARHLSLLEYQEGQLRAASCNPSHNQGPHGAGRSFCVITWATSAAARSHEKYAASSGARA